MRSQDPMVVDCDSCPVREVRCDDCMVMALGERPASYGQTVPLAEGELPLDAGERRAVERLVARGLVDADHTSMLVARREPWVARAVG